MKTFIVGLIVILLVASGGYLYMRQRSVTRSVGQAMQGAPPASSTSTGGRMLFTDSPDHASAYQIYPGPLSADAQKAVENFSMDTAAGPNGTITVTLTPKNAEEQKQSYTVTSGQKLYFVEKFMADDQPQEDRNLQDDYGIVVGADGYIVPQ